jgi:hypothetical protein
LHDVHPRDYLEKVLRLAPHWRTSRMLELSPKYWKSTLSRLSPDQLRILIPPWEQTWPVAPRRYGDDAAVEISTPRSA